ncbi:class I SAM-dependent methyltransferase [Serratia microhaemolytica]|uniref:class I SAM-dependent methyltransferase n=1 Tax=Serratia microhaemolytica TaxID=2675110 RepID=UPI000FDEA508|nr:methyltransferase domain-containing protein [Serratia microhaemolytica]
MDLKEIDILGDKIENHWYYRSKSKAMMRFLNGYVPDKILDVGAGSGFFSQHLLSNTNATEAWCVDISYQSDFDDNKFDKMIHYRREISDVGVDLVLFMDVLEHVDNDVMLLKEYVDKVPKGCQFLISVPAFQFLWSGHDDFLEHKRRYRLNHLESIVNESGLSVIHGSYYFGAVFPIAALLRLINSATASNKKPKSHLVKHHPMINGILDFFCRAELPFMRLNRVMGLTAFCLAEKK